MPTHCRLETLVAQIHYISCAYSLDHNLDSLYVSLFPPSNKHLACLSMVRYQPNYQIWPSELIRSNFSRYFPVQTSHTRCTKRLHQMLIKRHSKCQTVPKEPIHYFQYTYLKMLHIFYSSPTGNFPDPKKQNSGFKGETCAIIMRRASPC